MFIPLIEQFLVLKLGEVCQEVLDDADVEGCLRSSFDGDKMCSLLDQKNLWANHSKTKQDEILLYLKIDVS